jgi:hypothetical protein
LPRYFSASRGPCNFLFLDSYSTYALILVVTLELHPVPLLTGLCEPFGLPTSRRMPRARPSRVFNNLQTPTSSSRASFPFVFIKLQTAFFVTRFLSCTYKLLGGGGGGQKANPRRNPAQPAFHRSSISFKIISLRHIYDLTNMESYSYAKTPGASSPTKPLPRPSLPGGRTRPLSTGHWPRNTGHVK